MARRMRPAAEKTPSQYNPLLLALLTFCLVTLKPDLHAGGSSGVFDMFVSLLSGYQAFSLPVFLLLPGLWLFYRFASGKLAPGSLRRPSVLVPAVLFGVSMPLGYAFEETSSLDPVFSSGPVPLLQALLAAAGWCILACYVIALLYSALERAGREQAGNVSFSGPLGRYRRLLSAHPFLTVFITLAVLYIPHAVISFPGIFMGDTWQQVVQAYSQLESTGSPYLSTQNIMKAGVYINQNHPAVPTLLLHCCLIAGDAVTGSLNASIALWCGLQALCLIASLSYAASVFIRRGLFPLRSAWVIPLYGFVNPYIHTSIVLLTKDVCYSAFFLFLFVNLFRVLAGERARGLWIGTALSALGIVLFRNEGRYLLLVSFLAAALICRETRKAFLLAFGGILAVSLLVFRLLFPLLGFTPGSVREPLSIPFQQTARCVRDCPDDVTEEERTAINRVLVYESLAGEYDPNLSDPVKNTFRESASAQDLLDYFGAWAGMGLRHPDVYLQAFLNKNYQYFYPGAARLYLYDNSWSTVNYNFTNQKIAPLGKSFSQPERFAAARAMHDRLMLLSENVPVLDILCTPALYAWAVILAFCWALRRKNRRLIAWTVFPFLLLLLNLFTPANAYYGRYMLPVMLALPFFRSFLTGLPQDKTP